MKGELLSIGEVSKMKGVGVKSLRYYERIGILKPAYVNPSSGYRYYSMRQLAEIDIITTCIDLGIPLRRLRFYMDENDSMDLVALLEWGHDVAVENARRAEVTLNQWSNYLAEAQTQKALNASEGLYERTMPDRFALYAAWGNGPFAIKRYVTLTTALYEQAKAAGIVPLYAQGLVREEAKPASSWQAFVSVAIPSWLSSQQAREAIASAGSGRLGSMPSGTFCGRRVKSESLGTCFASALSQCESKPGVFVVTEVWDSGLGDADYTIEVLARA